MNEKLESLLKTLNQESKASAKSEVKKECMDFFLFESLYKKLFKRGNIVALGGD